MKKISILIPCYNEEENVRDMVRKIKEVFLDEELKKYNYEIVFIDNASTDNTQKIIESDVSYYISNVKQKNLTNFTEIKEIDGLYLYKRTS